MGEDGPAAFQDTVSRIDSDAPPEGIVTFLFDLLHVDGEDLLDTPLEERAARLEAIAPHLKIPARPHLRSRTRDERVLDEALRAGHEGVVVKDAASLYGAGRRGKAWRKVKPVRTYDLVVLGAEWGHGRRQGWLSNLHLGARDPATGEFVMVGKCFKGLTDELLEWQTKELLERETERRGIAVLRRVPSWWSRSRSTASSPRPATRAASRCASRASSATGRTRAPTKRTRSTTCARCFRRGRNRGPHARRKGAHVAPRRLPMSCDCSRLRVRREAHAPARVQDRFSGRSTGPLVLTDVVFDLWTYANGAASKACGSVWNVLPNQWSRLLVGGWVTSEGEHGTTSRVASSASESSRSAASARALRERPLRCSSARHGCFCENDLRPSDQPSPSGCRLGQR